MQPVPSRPTTPPAPAKPRSAFWRDVRRNWWCYAFLLPWLALNLTFVVYPQLASYPYTLYNWDGIGRVSGYVGLDNFTRVLQDQYFWRALRNTFVYAVVLVPVQLTLALILALILNNPKLRFSNFYRALFFSPAVTSAAVVGIVIAFLINQTGPQLSAALAAVGVIEAGEQINVLADPRFALWAIIIVGIWKTFGLNLVNFLAALQSIPQELYESARIDGATPRQEFWFVTVPMLRTPGLVIVFLAFVGSLSVFDLALVMVGTGATALLADAEVVGTYIYRQAFGGGGNVGFATAAALVMGLITVALSLAQLALFKALGIRRPGLTDKLGTPDREATS